MTLHLHHLGFISVQGEMWVPGGSQKLGHEHQESAGGPKGVLPMANQQALSCSMLGV